ncbi:MAG: replication protein RepA [Bryobacteraceae bacterium]
MPLLLATLAVRQQKQTITFRSAAQMLETFSMQQGGSQYRRLVCAFQRPFGATIFFGTDTQRQRALVTHQARFNFLREARIWYSRDPNQALLPGGFDNGIVLTDEFFHGVTTHSIPTDLEAAKALSCAPAALGLFVWLSYRCFTAKSPERIPIFGDFRLAAQLGSEDYARPRKFRERLERWLDLVQTLWPACPARIAAAGDAILIQPATALMTKGASMASVGLVASTHDRRLSLADVDAVVSA